MALYVMSITRTETDWAISTNYDHF